MAFSLDQFYRINRRALIWLALLALLYLLKDFFGLVFLTFVLVFFGAPMARAGHERLRIPYRLSLVLVYVLYLGLVTGFVSLVTPNVIKEANRVIENLPGVQERVLDLNHRFAESYPGLHKPTMGWLRSTLDDEARGALDASIAAEAARLGTAVPKPGEEAADPAVRTQLRNVEEQQLLRLLLAEQSARVRAHAPRMINLLYQASATTLLGLLFSFLILWDWKRLSDQVEGLRHSRLHDFYDEAAKPVVRLTETVGRGLQAQALIALVNTVLTLIGLLVLGIPSLAMLSLIVFVCSFLPVIGVFVSSVPLVLVALNAGGLELAFAAVVMIFVVHAIEAYFLNPMIYGHTLSLNPVLSLIILFVAYHAFGIWGMLLGVPVARYFIHDVFGVPLGGRPVRAKRKPPPPPPPSPPPEKLAA